MDGLSANDDAAGLSGLPYGVDAVEQFQVVSSGGQAELGRALGGYVNVVTRSGTNQVRDTAYGFFRDDALATISAATVATVNARRRRCGLQRRHHHLSACRSRVLRLLVAGELPRRHHNAGFTQTFGDTVVQQGSTSLGLYARDEWSATPRLTLNLGLRYDLQKLETIDSDTNNVAPRAGFVWTPFDSRDLVVRGSAGLYFDCVPLRALANALLSADNTTDLSKLRQLDIALTPGQASAPVFPGILPAPVPSVTLFSLTTMQRDLQNACSRQASLEVERQLGTAEVFNLTNAVNEIARNANFGAGAYPTPPSATYNQVTAVGDPRAWQLAMRLRF